MGHLLATLVIIGSIVAALSNQLADEFKAWTPWIAEQLISIRSQASGES